MQDPKMKRVFEGGNVMPEGFDEDEYLEDMVTEEYDNSGHQRCHDMIYDALVYHDTVVPPEPPRRRILGLTLPRIKKTPDNPTRTIIRPKADYVMAIDPFSNRGYPVKNIGILARVTRDRQMNWINTPLLTRCLNRGNIGYLFNRMGYSRHQRIKAVEKVIARIGTESYSPEWTRDGANRQIDNKIGPSTKRMPDDANRILACTLADKITRHFKSGRNRILRIMDVGTGTGNTIIPLLEVMNTLASTTEDTGVRDMQTRYRLNSIIEEFRGEGIGEDFYKYVRLYLVDVSRDALMTTYNKVKRVVPGITDNTPAGGVILVHDNFLNLAYNPCLRDIVESPYNRLDVIVSGAAICHQTEFQQFFRQMHSLLGEDGLMHVWDWKNAQSFAAPNLRIGQYGGDRVVFEVTCADGRLYIKDIPDGEQLQLKEREALYDKLETARNVRVIYEMGSESGDSELVLSNFRTWLGFLGYIDWEGMNKRATKIEGDDVDKYLARIYHKYTQMEQGFNFCRFLELLEGVEPIGDKSAYNVIEGTGKSYAKEMMEAGFSYAEESTMPEVHRQGRDSYDEETLSDITRAHQIHFAFGRR
ncbi:class I SAM-dependent methyltransferase [Nanoarchaeota archaeon]